MVETVASYEVRVSGLWTRTHTLSKDGEVIGTLRMERGSVRALGMVVSGVFTPKRGEQLIMRRDPGLLRSQYSLWTDGREWLGSALRWSFFGRQVVLHTGSKPLRMLPTEKPGFGWTLQAPRTGEMARILGAPFSRRRRIEVTRKVDFELVVFSYFLAVQILGESWLSGPSLEALLPPSAPKVPKTPAASKTPEVPST